MFYLCLVYIQTNILFMCYNYKFTLYFSFNQLVINHCNVCVSIWVGTYYYTM